MTFKQHMYKSQEYNIYGDFMEFTKREEENRMSSKDVEFNKFKKNVDRILVTMCGLSSDDLPDATWYDYFDCELSPLAAIESAVSDSWWDEPGIEEQFNWYITKDGV